MLEISAERREEVVNEAILRSRKAPKDASRWERAIIKADEFLSDNRTLAHMDDEGDTLYIISPQSGDVYEVGEHCVRVEFGKPDSFCKSYDQGRPCWHRAAKRIAALALAEPIQID